MSIHPIPYTGNNHITDFVPRVGTHALPLLQLMLECCGAIWRDLPGLLMRTVYNPAPTICTFAILPQLLLAVLLLSQLLSQLLKKFCRSETAHHHHHQMAVLLLG